MRTVFCKHYRGMAGKTHCEAGVAFADLEHYGTTLFRESCPCFGKHKDGKCEHSEYPTEEEIAEREAKFAKDWENVCIARKAIVDAIGGPWERGMEDASGAIDCPICGAQNGLKFSRSGYNGHIHARCSTVLCVAWME